MKCELIKMLFRGRRTYAISFSFLSKSCLATRFIFRRMLDAQYLPADSSTSFVEVRVSANGAWKKSAFQHHISPSRYRVQRSRMAAKG